MSAFDVEAWRLGLRHNVEEDRGWETEAVVGKVQRERPRS